MPNDEAGDKIARVRAYKLLLQEIIDRRPSGTRGRIAAALGRNRSFVSQITSARYDIPIPAQHVPTILDVCHATGEERQQFLDSYGAAHPDRGAPADAGVKLRPLVVYLPDLPRESQNKALDKLVIDFVRGLRQVLD